MCALDFHEELLYGRIVSLQGTGKVYKESYDKLGHGIGFKQGFEETSVEPSQIRIRFLASVV